jgi:valyl-tRNA synthetase
MLITSLWPEKIDFESKEARKFGQVITTTEFARKVKAVIGAEIEISSADNDLAELAEKLAGLKTGDDLTSSLVVPELEGWNLLISEENLGKYREEIGKRVDEIQKQIKNLESRLDNESYMEKAPKKLVDETKESLGTLRVELKELKQD